MPQTETPYRIVKPRRGKTAVFINIQDPEAPDALRVKYGNRELVVSVALYELADPSSPCTYALCFRIRSSSLEQVRRRALEVVYYLAENWGIPVESVDLIYNGGGIVAEDDVRAKAHAGARVEIAILVPPTVFSGQPTPLMPTLNYDLARQMNADGIAVDVDVYAREQRFVPLPDSLNGSTNRYAVVLSEMELLHLGPKGIVALAMQPRGDISLAFTRPVPGATEWYAEALEEAERRERRTALLRQMLLARGWQIPACIRRLHWMDLPNGDALEACRVLARYYAFINASEDEIWNHVNRMDRRHDIRDHARLSAIVTFAVQQPTFPGCDHPLLKRSCPRGGCFMDELVNELEHPRLFT